MIWIRRQYLVTEMQRLLSNDIEYKVVGVCIANVCCGIRALTCRCFCLNFFCFFLILLWVFQLIFSLACIVGWSKNWINYLILLVRGTVVSGSQSLIVLQERDSRLSWISQPLISVFILLLCYPQGHVIGAKLSLNPYFFGWLEKWVGWL